MKVRGIYVFAFMAVCGLTFSSCGSSDAGKNGYPTESLSDTAKVSFIMERCKPDSVAKYICNTFLGWNNGATLKSMSDAVTYAYTHYQGDDLIVFSETFDDYTNSLPLPSRMIILSKAAVSDADGLGYRLGLEYAADIQSNRKNLQEIDREISELKKACGADSMTYFRMLTGLSVALAQPEYKSLPSDILKKYGTAPKISHHTEKIELENK